MSDYMESLFQGVEILIDKKLEDLAYDTSLICCITDNSDSKNGKYRVSDGSVSYTVYSEDDSYKVGDYVRIIIPNNDYSQKKFISGKYVLDDSTLPITYVSSTDSVVNISGNLTDPIINETYGIVANGSIKQKTIWGYDFSENDELENFQSNNICNTIILSANFQTLLSSYNLIEGTYGLQVELFVKPGPTSTGLVKKVINLSTEDMFGNPYSFSIPSTQSKTFSFSVSNGLIQGIKILLFQNGDFKDSQKGYIIPLSDKPDDILVSNIQIGFGSNITDMEDNVIELYSKQDLSYNYNPHSAATNLKDIGLLWYNKSEENKYIGFSDGLYDPNYDELEYLQRSYVDARLVQQKGKVNIPQDKIGLSIAADIYEVSSIVKRVINIANTDLINTFLNLKNDIKVYNPTVHTGTFSEKNININDFIDSNSTLGIQKFGASIENALKNIKDAYEPYLEYIYKNGQGNKDANINTLHLSTLRPLLQKFETYSKTVIANLMTYLEDNHYSAYYAVVDMYSVRLKRIYNAINDILSTFNINNLQSLDTIEKYFKNASDLNVYAEQSFEEYDNKYCIYWYHYEKGYKPTGDSRYHFMPEGWKRLESFNNVGLPKYASDDRQEINSNGQVINLSQSAPGEGLIQYYMQHDSTEEKFVAVIFYNHEMFKSEELVFINSQDFTDKLTLDKSDSLTFNHKSNSYDSYLIYNELFYLKDSSDSQKLREVQCSYNGRLLQDDDVLPNASIYWYIPNTSTMLTYDATSLINRGFVTDENLSIKPSYSKDGFVCFYKKINSTYDDIEETYNYTKETTINGETIRYDERSFWYKIKPYYEQSTTQNFIICKIIPEGESGVDAVETKLFFSFGVAGTNGTKYTLAITNAGNQPCVTSNKPLTLNISLRDANNESINVSSNYSTKWIFQDKGQNIASTSENNAVIVRSSSDCGILKFEISNFELETGKKVNFAQKHPIAWGADNYYISGPTSIIYNSFGTLDRTSIFDVPYKLFNATTDAEITDDVTWSLEYYTKDGEASHDNAADKFYIDHAPTINESGLLTPSPLYLDNIENEFFVVVVATHDKKVVWRQPILVMQNRYGSPLINKWNGEFVLDDDNGTLLASMIGAGRKSSDNTFEGVLMGDVGGSAAADKTGIGLYGYHDGAQSFGLMSDGTAFFGKAGKGRILIDGDRSTIQSQSYQNISETSSGMCIDLDDGWIELLSPNSKIKFQTKQSPYFSIASIVEGNDKDLIEIGSTNYFLQTENFVQESRDTAGVGTRIDLKTGQIDAYNFKLKSNRVLINSSDSASTYFQILSYEDTDSTNDKKPLICIGKTNYYFQTADYDETKEEGAKFDLRSGDIESYKGFTLKAGTGTSFLGLSSTPFSGTTISENSSWRILAGSEFGVSSTGKLYASGAVISGKVDITSGSIKIGTNFEVTKEGNVTANSINATGGKIGGWTLSGGNLSSGNMTIYGTGYISSVGAAGKFDVTSEGQLQAESAKITGEINAGSGSIGNWKISSGSLTNTSNTVQLTSDGKLFAQSGTIGGWTIDGSNLKSSNMILNGSKGTISAANGNTSFSVDNSGQMKAKASILENLTVNKTFTTGEKCVTTLDGTLTVDGNTTIKGDFVLEGTVNFDPKKFTIGGVAPFASEQPISIRVDVPWSLTDYDLIIHNGLIKEVRTTNKSGEKKDVITYTATTSTVGAANNPVYLLNGTITASNTTIGENAATPINLRGGKFGLLTTEGIGASNQPIYLNNKGAIAASSLTLGGDGQFIYMENGQFKATTKTLGSRIKPLYLNGGAFAECNLNHSHTISATVTVREYRLSGDVKKGYTLEQQDVDKPVKVTIGSAL